jgi:chaperonin GroES
MDGREVLYTSDASLDEIKLLRDIIYIRPDRSEEASPGGILLTAEEDKEQHCGEIVNVGPGRWVDGKLIKMQVKVGDRVLFNKTSGFVVKVGGEKFIAMCADKDVLAILKDSVIKPLGNRIVVKRAEEEDITEGGIIIPDTAKKEQDEGSVIAISDKINDVTVNDNIIFSHFIGGEVELDGQELLIMYEGDVLAVVG